MRHARQVLGAALLLIATSALTGCSSIVSGGRDTVSFTSNPTGARIRVVDRAGKEVQSGTTPCKLDLNRGQGYFTPAQYKVLASAPGVPEREVPLRAGLNGWYFGNIVFGGLVGMIVVDPLTGAMWDLPETSNIEMGSPTMSLSTPAPPAGYHDYVGASAATWK